VSAVEPRAGRYFELATVTELRDNGYWVLRSPASKGPVDMVAIKPGQVLFVQCKKDGQLRPGGWNALIQVARQAGGLPIMAERPERGKIAYWELCAMKDGLGGRQPMRPFHLDEVMESGGVT
jgi:Holliday junction resolvase